MLFKRGKKLSFFKKIKTYIKPWISITAFGRSFTYIKHRLLRLPSSTRDIALGLAIGFAVSFTPTWGFHIIQCYIFCLVLRANFLAALLGTLFGNPWTFPLLIWVSFTVGEIIVNGIGLDHFFVLKGGEEFIKEDHFGMAKFLPTLIGGYAMAGLSLPVFYIIFYSLINGARKARVKVQSFKNKKEEEQ